MRTARLYVVRPPRGPALTDAALRKFLDDEVGPRFPDGMTVLRGGHAWRGRDAKLVRESDKVVQIVVPGGEEGDHRIELVRTAYRTSFRQEPVLQLAAPACIAF